MPIIFTVGINTYNPSDYFKLYSNPSTGKFYLEFDKPEHLDIQIFDFVGRVVFKGSFNEQKMELQLLHADTYIVDINRTTRRKVVVIE